MRIAVSPKPFSDLLTAEEVCRRYGGQNVELVRGHVVEAPMAGARHGRICSRVSLLLGQFVEANDLGHVMSNETLVVAERGPDTGRGADICLVSYARLPKGQVPEGPLTVPPELVIEVRSPSDRWAGLVAKALEYLNAGVNVVVILDPKTESATAFRLDDRQAVHESGDDLTLPDVLPGFAVPVRKFFE